MPRCIMSRVFGFLTPREVLISRGLCANWRVPALWPEVTLKPDDPMSLAQVIKLCYPLHIYKCLIKRVTVNRDFEELERLQQLRTLVFENGVGIPTETIKRVIESLAHLHTIHWVLVSLELTEQVADIMQPYLKRLQFIPQFRRLTNKDMDQVCKLIELEELDIGFCAPAIEGDGLANFKNLTKLEKLTLASANRLDLTHIGQLVSLRELLLYGCYVEARDIQHFATLPRLEKLIVNHSLIDDSALNNLLPLHKSLKHLDVRYSLHITDAGMLSVGKLNLHELIIDDCRQVTDLGLSYLKSLSLLKLSAAGLHMVTDEGCQRLAEIKTLRDLNVSNCAQITDKGAETISSMIGLESLTMESCHGVTSAGVLHLARLCNLIKLNLACNLLLDDAFERVGAMVCLKSLDLAFCNTLTNACLPHIERISGLEFLNIHECRKFTALGLYWLKQARPQLLLAK